MNNINLTGRLTKNPELKYTSNDKSVCEFSIAVNRIGQEQADFINCQVWNKQAENLTKYQGKGSLIGVEGSLKVDNFQDKDGNNRYKTYVLVSNIEYLESKKKETELKEEVKNDVDPFTTDVYSDFGEEIIIDDNFLD